MGFFGNLMNNYYYGKAGKGDYTVSDMPKNRFELFGAVLKVRWSALFGVNLLYMLFWLPTFVWVLMNVSVLLSTETALEAATLQSYLDPEKAREEIPTLRMLSVDPARLKLRAELLRERLEKEGVLCEVVPEQDQVGGGSVPTQLLPTWAVAVTPRNLTVDGLEERLRTRSATPIIGRIAHERYLLDVRTLWEEDFALIAASVAEADR